MVTLTSTVPIDEQHMENKTMQAEAYHIVDGMSINRTFSVMNAEFLCTKRHANDQGNRLDLITSIITSFIGSKFDVSLRKSYSDCQVAKILFVLRANNKEAVDEMLRGHLSGTLSLDLAKSVVSSFNNITNEDILLSIELAMNAEAMTEYREVYVPFQGK